MLLDDGIVVTRRCALGSYIPTVGTNKGSCDGPVCPCLCSCGRVRQYAAVTPLGLFTRC
jgi:hypothetical protein